MTKGRSGQDQQLVLGQVFGKLAPELLVTFFLKETYRLLDDGVFGTLKPSQRQRLVRTWRANS